MMQTLILIVTLSVAACAAQRTERSFQVVETSIDEIHAAYKANQLTAHQLVQMYLDRIQAYDQRGPAVNCVITILVKDEIDAAGMPTTLGTLVFKVYRPPRDAFVIEKLKKAGAIILGKT